MSSLQRRVGILILIALLLLFNSIMILAQDTAVTVVGSGISTPLIAALGDASGVATSVNVTGTNDGFASFCKGEADVTTGTRAISAAEESSCDQAGVSFLEFVVGYDVAAVVANPQSDFGTCLTSAQLNSLFAPSSAAANWNQVADNAADLPLSLYVPAENTTPHALLDSVVEGVGLRADLNAAADDAAIIDAVSTTKGALGVVSLQDALAAGDKVTILQLNTTTAGCAAPSADTAAGRTYTAAYTLYAYANAAQVDKLKPLFAYAFGADGSAAVEAAGVVAAPAETLATDQSILDGVKTGRQFSKDVTAYTIPANLVGTINMAGSAFGADYVTAVTNAFVQQYAGVTLNHKVTGEPDAVRQLCNGESDLINSFSALTDEQTANCAANNIPTEAFDLGYQAVVLLGNGDFLTCLTTDEITKVWTATSEKSVTNWNQVNASFPDLPITLVAPPVGDAYADLLMLQASGQSEATREDFAEAKASSPYRITAVGNVAGGMTYMSWVDYSKLSADDQAKATLVSVDAGNGCVAPSAATIADGSYKLARSLYIIVNRISMARTEIQSLLWYIAQDANYPLLASNGFVGLDFAALPDLRDRLQKSYVQAATDAADAAARAAAATPEPTAEATPESTPAS